MSEEPLYPTAIVGYRFWTLHSGYLNSTGIGGLRWRPGINRAVCVAGKEHPAPDQDCECGLYAYHDAAVLGPDEPSRFQVGGAVLARGRTQVHARGFRAEQMQVLALYLPWLTPRPVKREVRGVARRYRVPVVRTLRRLRRLAERHGAPVPDSVRPERPAPRLLSRGEIIRYWVRNMAPTMAATGLGAFLVGLAVTALLGGPLAGLAVSLIGCFGGALVASPWRADRVMRLGLLVAFTWILLTSGFGALAADRLI